MFDAQSDGVPHVLETLSLMTLLAGRVAVPSGPLASLSMLYFFTPFLLPFREFGLLYPYIKDFEYSSQGLRHML